jgi:hypothetical protein
MQTLSPLGARGKPEPFATPSSTGTAFDGGWRHWWREQAQIDGTDWSTLCWQHIGTLYALRSLCESSRASS